jgi:ribonuclease Z
MYVTMLGTAAALPDPDRRHTAILLTLDGGRRILLDCGHGATINMVRSNVNPADVPLVFLTHLHHDHISDLPFFLLESWILNRVGSPTIVGPKGTAHFLKCVLEGGGVRRGYSRASQVSGASVKHRGHQADRSGI